MNTRNTPTLKQMSYAIAVLVLGWYTLVILFQFPPYILPTPKAVLISMMNNPVLLAQQTYPTVIETFSGLILGTIFGVICALAMNYWAQVRHITLPLILSSQALPLFAVAPLLVIWFGYGLISKIILSVLMIFFPIASNFYDGLKQTPKAFLDLAQVMQAKSWRSLWYIKIPHALPNLANGIRIGATIAPLAAIMGEWVGSSEGLGYLILNANAKMQIDLMFAGIAIIVTLTLFLYFIVDRLLSYWIN